MLDGWCEEEGLSWSYAPWTSPLHKHHITELDRSSNPFWAVFEASVVLLAYSSVL